MRGRGTVVVSLGVVIVAGLVGPVAVIVGLLLH